MDKVSVIIPVYNGDKYLERCIKSLLNQTYKNTEYIFINDGSTDKTKSILENITDKRVTIINKKNTGVSDSRNLGVSKVTGNYICFCDADDMYEKNYIEEMLKLIKEKHVDAVRCNFKVIDKNDNFIDKGHLKTKLYNKNIKQDLIPLCLKGTVPCFTYLLMIKKDKLNIKFPVDVAMMEDVVFYINLLTNIDSIYVFDKCLYTIMFNEEGATNNVKNYKRNINNIILANSYIKRILKENNLFNKENIQKINVNNLNAIADFIFKNYLYGEKAIKICMEINNKDLKNIINETNLKEISFSRKIILKLLKKENYSLLKIYFVLRRIIFKLKRCFK